MNTDVQKTDTAAAKSDNKNPEFYLQNLPLNDSLLAISNEKVAIAMLNAGKAYADRINDPAKATETWEALKQRFPGNELVPEALFYLYRLNKDINGPRSETYRQELLSDYPESEFARILSDPGYYEKKLADIKFSCEGYVGKYELKVRDSYFFCRAGINIASIMNDGSVSACPNIDRSFVQGNIYSDNFFEVWQNRYELLRDRSWTKKGICSGGNHYKNCLGNGLHNRRGPDGDLLVCHNSLIEKALSDN